jgi:hypothetical protein
MPANPSPVPRKRRLRTIAGIAASFIGLAGTIIFLLAMKIVSLAMAKLMLVALLGLYVGFGVLIAVYRLITKLE